VETSQRPDREFTETNGGGNGAHDGLWEASYH
jgi:hypothetical protein